MVGTAAATAQSTQVTGTFNGGPYADAKFTTSSGTMAVTQKASATHSHIGVLVDWFPLEKEGLHVGGSVGFGAVTVTTFADDSTSTGTGAAGSLLVGYDWPIAPNWALGLSLVATGSTRMTLKDQDSNETGYKLKPYSVGLVASFLYF